MLLAYAALGAAVALWGLSFPMMKYAVEQLGPFDVAVYRIALGAVGSAGLCLVDASMSVAYGLWYAGLARIGAAATGATVLGIPLVGATSSWAFLGEPIGPLLLLAGALIVAGLRLVLPRRG